MQLETRQGPCVRSQISNPITELYEVLSKTANQVLLVDLQCLIHIYKP